MKSVRYLSVVCLTFHTSVLGATRDGNPRSWILSKANSSKHTTYLVEYRICLLETADTLKANALSNALNRVTGGGDAGSAPAVDGSFRRTDRLVLRYHCGSKNIAYEIRPAPARTKPFPDVNEVHFYFDKTDHIDGIPFVNVKARIECGSSINPYERLKNPAFFLRKTDAWPVGTPVPEQLLAGMPMNDTNELTRLESVLQWLPSRSGIRLGREPKGQRATRYGVAQTVAQKHGNCWDYSDLFITLCRSLGLPCRQVAGWQRNGGGHVWAEVYIPNIGWLQVNPTTGRTVDDAYIPLFGTSDGRMSIVYRSFPTVKVVAGGARPAR